MDFILCVSVFFTNFIIRSGSTNFAPNSPIKGYRKVPNGDKFIKFIKRRPGCDALPTNEHRTTMLCSTCHRRNEPPTNSKQRYRTCRHCGDRSDLTLRPPNEITTFIGKRKFQRIRSEEHARAQVRAQDEARARARERERERAQAPNEGADMEPAAVEAPQRPYGPYRPLEQPPRSPELASKLVTIVKNDRLVEADEVRPNKVWNRDVNAGRNILSIGRFWLFYYLRCRSETLSIFSL